jgi:hypothetical protein
MQTSGDPKHGFFGHPRCEFCRARFYDKSHLFEHLTKEHYTCHLCEAAGQLHKYYRDYNDLERHFRKDHHLCEVSSYAVTACTLDDYVRSYTVECSSVYIRYQSCSMHTQAVVTIAECYRYCR